MSDDPAGSAATQPSDPPRDDDGSWWFCLRHQRVERGAGCPNADRLGPYRTEQEASTALDRAAARNESWDSDPRWDDD